MSGIPLAPLLLASACLAACLLAALHAYRRRLPERGYWLGALAFAAAAAAVWIGLAVAAGGAPSLLPSAIYMGLAALLAVAGRRARRLRLATGEPPATRSFRENSALVMLAALLLVFGNYFRGAWDASPETAIGAFVGAVVSLVVLLIAAHVALAVLHLPVGDLDAPGDERDRAVDLKSQRNAYWVLTAAFWTFPFMLIAAVPLAHALNIWLAELVLAELVYFGSMVAYYRLGAD